MENKFIEARVKWDDYTYITADEDGVEIQQYNSRTRQVECVCFCPDSENNVYDTIDNVILYLQALKKKLHEQERSK